MKRQLTKGAAKYVFNPIVRGLFELGVPVPGTAILETTGHKSGLTRHTPVTDGLEGDVFWLVAEHGHNAAYVRNIEADPRVRVRVGGKWRSGTARLLPEEDPHRRLRRIATKKPRSFVNALAVLAWQTDLLTVRIDLDP